MLDSTFARSLMTAGHHDVVSMLEKYDVSSSTLPIGNLDGPYSVRHDWKILYQYFVNQNASFLNRVDNSSYLEPACMFNTISLKNPETVNGEYESSSCVKNGRHKNVETVMLVLNSDYPYNFQGVLSHFTSRPGKKILKIFSSESTVSVFDETAFSQPVGLDEVTDDTPEEDFLLSSPMYYLYQGNLHSHRSFSYDLYPDETLVERLKYMSEKFLINVCIASRKPSTCKGEKGYWVPCVFSETLETNLFLPLDETSWAPFILSHVNFLRHRSCQNFHSSLKELKPNIIRTALDVCHSPVKGQKQFICDTRKHFVDFCRFSSLNWQDPCFYKIENYARAGSFPSFVVDDMKLCHHSGLYCSSCLVRDGKDVRNRVLRESILTRVMSSSTAVSKDKNMLTFDDGFKLDLKRIPRSYRLMKGKFIVSNFFHSYDNDDSLYQPLLSSKDTMITIPSYGVKFIKAPCLHTLHRNLLNEKVIPWCSCWDGVLCEQFDCTRASVDPSLSAELVSRLESINKGFEAHDFVVSLLGEMTTAINPFTPLFSSFSSFSLSFVRKRSSSPAVLSIARFFVEHREIPPEHATMFAVVEFYNIACSYFGI